MTFEEILDQVLDMLQRRGRVTYGALKRQFNLDDAYLEDVKNEVIEGQQLAVDENGRVLVWTGPKEAVAPASALLPAQESAAPLAYTPPHLTAKILAARAALEGERKQVTVLFADLKGSTELIEGLDPGRRPGAPGPGPASHDGGCAPLRGHGESGARRRHHGPVWRTDCP